MLQLETSIFYISECSVISIYAPKFKKMDKAPNFWKPLLNFLKLKDSEFLNAFRFKNELIGYMVHCWIDWEGSWLQIQWTQTFNKISLQMLVHQTITFYHILYKKMQLTFELWTFHMNDKMEAKVTPFYYFQLPWKFAASPLPHSCLKVRWKLSLHFRIFEVFFLK